MGRVSASGFDVFRLPAATPIWEWAERNIVISPRNPSAFPGPYRSSLTPYVRGVLECLNDDSVRQVSVMKGAQTGLTLTMHVALCYHLVEDPCPMLLVMPSETLARSCSETRIQPLIVDSPAVKAELQDDPDAFKLLEYRTKRAIINLVGGNSPSNVSSRPVRILLVDEADKLPGAGAEEAGTIPLAIERTNTFWNKKIVVASTPTTKGGYIHQAHQRGDQRKFFVPCPKCGFMQPLEWGRVRYDAEKPISESAAAARYACAADGCDARWTDAEKIMAVQRGEWRATAPAEDAGHASFHISTLYAPWTTWADLVTKWRTAQGNMSDLQSFINSQLGEPWEVQPVAATTRSAIRAIADRHNYERGTVPLSADGAMPCYLGAFFDVQKDSIPYAVFGLTLRDLYLVDHGLVPTLEDAQQIFDGTFAHGDGQKAVDFALIDTGYRTLEVYDWCLRQTGRLVIPIKGETGNITRQTDPVRAAKIGSYPDGKPLPYGRALTLRHIHPTYFHERAAALLGKPDLEEDQTLDEWLEKQPMRLHLHNAIDREYINQLTSEVLTESEPDKRGHTRLTWKRIRKANHQWDLLRYALAAWYLLQRDLQEPQQKGHSGAGGDDSAPVSFSKRVATYD